MRRGWHASHWQVLVAWLHCTVMPPLVNDKAAESSVMLSMSVSSLIPLPSIENSCRSSISVSRSTYGFVSQQPGGQMALQPVTW